MNLNQITVHSVDVNRAVEFYLELGLQLIVDSRPRYVRFACPQGDSTFSISHHDDDTPDTTTIYFEVENVDKTCDDLNTKGIRFKTKPKDQRWLWREAELTDPDGHHLKIYSAGINRKNPPWRVKVQTKSKQAWYRCFLESSVNLMK
jgi:catechol 2,3-dioxygenase-like lactoylglutathione lyase family enzyme